jgi:hypothetical protein
MGHGKQKDTISKFLTDTLKKETLSLAKDTQLTVTAHTSDLSTHQMKILAVLY